MEHIFPICNSWLIPVTPLIGAIIAGFFCTGSRKKFAHWPIWLGVGLAALLSFCLLSVASAACRQAPQSSSVPAPPGAPNEAAAEVDLPALQAEVTRLKGVVPSASAE